MGQSNFNKTATKVKENGADTKSRITGGYMATIVVFCAAIVLFLLFSILVAAGAISCGGTNVSPVTSGSDETPFMYDVDGTPYYIGVDSASSTTYYYFYDENNERVICTYDDTLGKLYYTDADGAVKYVDFSSTASGTDVSASDTTTAATTTTAPAAQ